jgi:xanthine dehydrogenase YagR molybdenum-binding subunit
MKKAIALAPDGWLPGGHPDPLIDQPHGIVGTPVSRLDGPLKVSAARRASPPRWCSRTWPMRPWPTAPSQGAASPPSTPAAPKRARRGAGDDHKNAPKMKPMPLFMTASKAAGGDKLPIMQDDKIHWNGEPVALVLAETQEQADHAGR